MADFLPIPLSLLIVSIGWIWYFKVESKLDYYHWPAIKKLSLRKFFDMMLLTVMLTLIMILFTNETLKWPTTWGNLIYDLFYARAMKGSNSAHIAAYMVIPLCFFYVWRKEHNSFKALLYSMFMVWFHEGTWIAFYYIAYGQYVDYSLLWARDISFIVMITGLGIMYSIKYARPNKILIAGWMGLVVLNILWLSIGFPISNVSSIALNSYLAIDAMGRTQWYYDLTTNIIEVSYWWYALMVFVLAEWYATKGLTRPIPIIPIRIEQVEALP